MAMAIQIKERNGFRPGQRIRTDQRFRKMFPKNRAILGVIINIVPATTEIRVKFDNYKYPSQIDERFLEVIS